MAGLRSQRGSQPLPHGMFQLYEVGGNGELRRLAVPFADAPPFFVVATAAQADTFDRLPHELAQLLASVERDTGLRYCRIVYLYDSSAHQSIVDSAAAERTIIWLGPAANDSDAALRCLNRLHERVHSTGRSRLWSRKEGQALLALAERAIWRDLSPELLAEAPNLWLCAGQSSISWPAVLHFRDLLSELASEGRMEHLQYANAIFDSHASNVISATSSIHDGARTLADQAYPTALSEVNAPQDKNDALAGLSAQLDHSIITVENRWSMLNQSIQPRVAPSNPSDLDLDAEIARYAQLLQQIDVLEADLEGLDGLTNHIRCVQYDARTPRSSPEISP